VKENKCETLYPIFETDLHTVKQAAYFPDIGPNKSINSEDLKLNANFQFALTCAEVTHHTVHARREKLVNYIRDYDQKIDLLKDELNDVI
jgi:hypothetical protein